jgi:hypothetical protein
MKTWHWIAIVGIVLIGGYLYFRTRAKSAATPPVGDKVGTGVADAGAPPLPNVNMSHPGTAHLLTFTRPNAFGRRTL